MRNRTKVIVAAVSLVLLIGLFAAVVSAPDETASPSVLELAEWCVANNGTVEFAWVHVWGNWSTDGTTIETQYGVIDPGSGYVDVEVEYVTCSMRNPMLPPVPK